MAAVFEGKGAITPVVGNLGEPQMSERQAPPPKRGGTEARAGPEDDAPDPTLNKSVLENLKGSGEAFKSVFLGPGRVGGGGVRRSLAAAVGLGFLMVHIIVYKPGAPHP